jgi:ketosteroid isomerase-like protein
MLTVISDGMLPNMLDSGLPMPRGRVMVTCPFDISSKFSCHREEFMSPVSRLPGSPLVVAAFAFLFFSVHSYPQPNDEAQIRALEHRFAVAFKAKDVDSIMANYDHSQNLVVFDITPPREYVGWNAYKKDWQDFFDSIGPIALFEVKDLTIHAEGSLAYSFSFQHYVAKTKTGGSRDLTVRVTDAYRKIDSKWLIVHEHVSVPVDLQTGKPDLQSKP